MLFTFIKKIFAKADKKNSEKSQKKSFAFIRKIFTKADDKDSETSLKVIEEIDDEDFDWWTKYYVSTEVKFILVYAFFQLAHFSLNIKIYLIQ